MGLKGKLTGMRMDKNVSFQKIAEYLLENRDYSDLKVQSIVDACNVSASGVIRFCKYLGFRGFSELKYQLVHDIEQDKERVEWEKAIRRSSDEHLAGIYEAFQETHCHMDTVQMNCIIEMLHEADEIVVIGLGSSWIIAKDLELRFKRIKKNCQALNDINLQYFAAKNAGEKTIFLGITYSGTTEPILNCLNIAKAEGASTILMTHSSNKQFEEIYDYVIYVFGKEGRDRRTSTICRLTMLYLVDMIYFMYMNRYSDEVTSYLNYNSMVQK